MINLDCLVFSPFSVNTYVLWSDNSKEAIVIDPGCYDKYEEDLLAKYISDNNLTVKYMINTHCHLDHVFGCDFVKRKYSPVYLIPEGDHKLLKIVNDQGKMFGFREIIAPEPDGYIQENIPLFLDNVKIDFLFTPGHTAGEMCLYLESEKILISGDVLFKEGVGRSDLWDGDADQLNDAIKTKLFPLPEDVNVYPGHGEFTTIGEEKKYNPFIY